MLKRNTLKYGKMQCFVKNRSVCCNCPKL